LEAPPGIEPGMEVLQTGPRTLVLLTRLAFWLALIRSVPWCSGGSVPKLFPSLRRDGGDCLVVVR
jgi:hypothetical protein